MLIKVSPTKAYRLELVKFKKDGPTFLSVRQLYATTKDPEYKPSKNGMTIPIEDGEARRVIKGLIKVLKNEDEKKPKLLERSR